MSNNLKMYRIKLSLFHKLPLASVHPCLPQVHPDCQKWFVCQLFPVIHRTCKVTGSRIHVPPGFQSKTGTLSKWGHQHQRREATKILLPNRRIFYLAYFYFGYPVHVCFYSCWNSIDFGISSWMKCWMLVLKMPATFWRQHGNGVVQVSIESRTAQMSAVFFSDIHVLFLSCVINLIVLQTLPSLSSAVLLLIRSLICTVPPWEYMYIIRYPKPYSLRVAVNLSSQTSIFPGSRLDNLHLWIQQLCFYNFPFP